MRVICIKTPDLNIHIPNISIVKEGESYTVADSGRGGYLEDKYYIPDWYELAEAPGYIYAQCLFIPCSDVDETEYANKILNNIFQTV